MLYDILLVVLVIYVCVSPYFYAKAVKFGMKIADKPEKAAEEPFFHVPKKKTEPKMSPEEKRRVQILANIERYDGTSLGQEKIQREKA